MTHKFHRAMPSTLSVQQAAWDEAQSFGLQRIPARAHTWCTLLCWKQGFDEPARPDIISGRRSPQKTRELLNRWRAGDPSVQARPALDSYHLIGAALDVESDVAGFRLYRWGMVRFWNARDGCDFGDCGHFSFPAQYPKPDPITT